MWSTWWWYGSLFYHKFMYDKRMSACGTLWYCHWGPERWMRMCNMHVSRVMDGRFEMYLDKYQRHKNITQQHLHAPWLTCASCRLRLSNFMFNNILSKIFAPSWSIHTPSSAKVRAGRKKLCHTLAHQNVESFFLLEFYFAYFFDLELNACVLFRFPFEHANPNAIDAKAT